MVISHRFELNQQLISELESWCDEQVDLEQAMYHSDRGMRHRVVVASVQTLIKRKRNGKRRMDKFNPHDFGLVLIDECFVGDTPVLMANGISRNIRDIRCGDRVVCYNGRSFETSRVVRQWCTGKRETIRLRFSNGRSLTCTPTHPILTKRGWIAAGNLKANDLITSHAAAGAEQCSVATNGGVNSDTCQDIKFGSDRSMSGALCGNISLIVPQSAYAGVESKLHSLTAPPLSNLFGAEEIGHIGGSTETTVGWQANGLLSCLFLSDKQLSEHCLEILRSNMHIRTVETLDCAATTASHKSNGLAGRRTYFFGSAFQSRNATTADTEHQQFGWHPDRSPACQACTNFYTSIAANESLLPSLMRSETLDWHGGFAMTDHLHQDIQQPCTPRDLTTIPSTVRCHGCPTDSAPYLLAKDAQKADSLVCWPTVETPSAREYRHTFHRRCDTNFVRLISTERGPSEDVFDIEVARHHNFVANGIVVHNCHYAVNKSYRSVISHFAQNPNCALVGVTATIDRLDGVGLSNVFNHVSTNYDINWGINNGWLVPINQAIYKLKCLKLDEIDSSNGDLNRDQLRRQVESDRVFHEMALPFVNELGESQGIFFAESVDFARRMVSFIKAYRMDKTGECPHNFAVSIDGKLSPQDPLRRALVADFRRGDIRVLVNCQVACLDEETEILSLDGWKSCDTITEFDQIACWDIRTKAIHFASPLAIEVRDRRPDESMVFLNTPRRSVRVTGDHRMAFRTGESTAFKVQLAKDCVGRFVRLPVSGTAQPIVVAPKAPEVPRAVLADRIRVMSCLNRKRGMTSDAALAEATAGCTHRAGLAYKPTSDLTLSECQFIGMWVGDGHCGKLSSGGVEYAIVQSTVNPCVCDWIRDVTRECGIDFVEKRVKPASFSRLAHSQDAIKFSFPRGTGGKSQARRGVFHIEPYLSKQDFGWLWGLDGEQFRAFLSGLWMADGVHGNSRVPTDGPWNSISSANVVMNDTIQAVGACRGMSITIRLQAPKHNSKVPLYLLNAKDCTEHIMTKHKLATEPLWRPERVWCVKSETGFIVTRRRGAVVVTGNTEGFNVPAVSLIGIGKLTKSRMRYTQMVGRGSRPLPGVVDAIADPELRRIAIANSEKPSCKILDYIGQSRRHELFCSLDLMYGSEPAPVLRRAKKILATDKFKGTTQEAIEKARKDVQARQKRDEERQITVGQEYELIDKDDDAGTYRLSDIEQPYCEWYLKKKQPTVGQQKMLKALGFSASQIREMNPRYASKAIEYAIKQAKTPFAKKLRREKMEQMGSTLSQAVDMLGAIKSAKTMDDLKLFGRVIAEDKAKGFEYVTEHRDKLAAAYKAKQQELGQ